MTEPDIPTLFAALDATWPAAEVRDVGGWRVRRGDGGGGRVSAATMLGGPRDFTAMEAVHSAWGQVPRVMVRPGEAEVLDPELDAAGYGAPEPTAVLIAPSAAMAVGPERLTAFTVDWPPLAIQREIWESHGIGAPRQAVMARCETPKITLLGRMEDRPVAAAFVAADRGIAMVHAVTVAQELRRRGLARNLMRAAAGWAVAVGEPWISVQVSMGNAPAVALYRALGMAEAGIYHYRTR